VIVRPEPDQPWPPLTTEAALDEFSAWVIEQRLRGEFTDDVCQSTLDAVERRRVTLMSSQE
jgi:heat shock protein HspQ